MITTFLNQKIIKNAFIYISSNAINKAIPFLLLPILTRYLIPSDYGIIAIFQVIVSLSIVFIGLNTTDAVVVNFFKIDKKEINVYIGNVSFIIIISFVLTMSIIYLLKSYLSYLLKFPENWLTIAVIVALSQVIITLAIVLWQVEQRPLPYGLFNIFQMLANISLSLYFIIILGWKWQGRLLGIIIASIVFGIIGIFSIYKRGYIKFSFNKDYIKDALFIGAPLIPHSLGGWIKTGIDRIFINSMVNINATGIYTVGYQVGMIIGFLSSSFNTAWSPFFFEKLRENKYNTKIKIVKYTYLYFGFMIILALLLGITSPIFLKFFVGKSFQGSSQYVIWIALGYAFEGIYTMIALYILYVKKTYILSLVTFSSALFNVICNYILIKYNGALGAAQSTFLTYFIFSLIVWIVSAKIYKMPWRLNTSK